MTTPPGSYVPPWQTLPESRRQRLSEWWDDLVAVQSLIEFRLGLRHQDRLMTFSPYNVFLVNAWNTDRPWIPPGRLDLAGEYMVGGLRGVAGSAQRDLLAAISVPTSDATPEERELALDIRAMLGTVGRL